MGQFQHTLRDALAAENLTQAALAAAVSVPQSQVSRWLSGSQNPKPPNLAALLPRFDDPTQARLLVAYLADIIPTDKRQLVQIIPNGATLAEQPPERAWPEGLSAETRRKLTQFAALIRDYPEIEAIVDELLSLAEKLK